MSNSLQAPWGAVINSDAMVEEMGTGDGANGGQVLGSALGLMATDGVSLFEAVGESGDAVEAYFECITTCSLDDGECITECTEILRSST